MMRMIGITALLAVAGCSPLVQIGGNTPRPDALYTVLATAPAAVPAGLGPVDMSRAVSVGTPDVPGALRTLRIPVTVSDTQVQYVVAAVWAEQPNRLFGRLLADTLANNGVTVIDARSAGRVADRQLSGQLLAFGADVSSGSPMVRVRYDATLAGPDGVRQRRFERDAPVGRVDGPQVTAALNQLANALSADVARWVASPAADKAVPQR